MIGFIVPGHLWWVKKEHLSATLLSQDSQLIKNLLSCSSQWPSRPLQYDLNHYQPYCLRSSFSDSLSFPAGPCIHAFYHAVIIAWKPDLVPHPNKEILVLQSSVQFVSPLRSFYISRQIVFSVLYHHILLLEGSEKRWMNKWMLFILKIFLSHRILEHLINKAQLLDSIKSRF